MKTKRKTKRPPAARSAQSRPIPPTEFARRAVQMLRRHADPDHAKQVQNYFKYTVTVYGVRTPVARGIEKDLFKLTHRQWSEDHALKLCDLMLPKKHLETKGIALLTLRRFAGKLGPGFIRTAEEWLSKDYVDNWACTDALCTFTLGDVIENNPETIPRVLKWTRSRNRWVRRAAAASFVTIGRRGNLLNHAYEIAERLFADQKDDLVQKANGWMLREAGRTDRARLERFLLKHGPRIPRTTLRYAIEHFPEKQRKQVLEMTRP